MNKIKSIAVALLVRLHNLVTWLKSKLVPEAEHTFDTIVADFHGAISKLRALSDKHRNQSVTKATQIVSLTTQIDGHIAEADRANTVANKLSSLVS